MKPTNDYTTLAQILRRSLPLFAVVALTGILITCRGGVPEADQTVALAATSVPTTASQANRIPSAD